MPVKKVQVETVLSQEENTSHIFDTVIMKGVFLNHFFICVFLLVSLCCFAKGQLQQRMESNPAQRFLQRSAIAYNSLPGQDKNSQPLIPLSAHANHGHTRKGRCFFGDSPSYYPSSFTGGFDPFDIDPRQNLFDSSSLRAPTPIAYQLYHRSGDHLVVSPIAYLTDKKKKMSVLALGLIARTARFIYDAFVFSIDWCVFLVLMMALYNVVMLIINRVRDAIVLWVVIFAAHVLIRFTFIYTDKDPDSPGVIAHSARFIYDAFLFSVEWSIFLILILAIYNLVILLLNHLHNAVIMWVVIFSVHVVFHMVYSHSSDYYDW